MYNNVFGLVLFRGKNQLDIAIDCRRVYTYWSSNYLARFIKRNEYERVVEAIRCSTFWSYRYGRVDVHLSEIYISRVFSLLD